MDNWRTGNSTPEVLIGRDGWDYLRISISDRGNSNWFDADVEIRCGVWHGQYTAQFESGELRSFAAELRKLVNELSGSAILSKDWNHILPLHARVMVAGTSG